MMLFVNSWNLTFLYYSIKMKLYPNIENIEYIGYIVILEYRNCILSECQWLYPSICMICSRFQCHFNSAFLEGFKFKFLR